MDTILDIVVYKNGEIELKISANKDTIWASINDIAKVFDIDRSVVSKHIKNIFKDNELDEKVVCANFAHTTKHGSLSNKTQTRDIKYYNLDIVLAVGYRTSSNKAIHFRKWATSVLKEYIKNGYAINTHKITEQRLTILEHDLANIKSHIKNNTIEIKHGIFFNGQIFDAHILLSDLIKSAKVSIILIDNYIDESILSLFSKNKNVKFIIYTQNISKRLQLDIEKYNKQYNNLEVKITKRFHDRFLICDETIYHFGASFKDLGNKIFAVNKMNILVNDLLKYI
ncbi:MAG: RhuM family protein [Halarcobacter sp.]